MRGDEMLYWLFLLVIVGSNFNYLEPNQTWIQDMELSENWNQG
jgi:hypothetical protein